MRGFIIRRDHSLMHRVNSWDAPRWMRAYAISSTRAGDGWIWYAMGVLVALFGGDQRFHALGAAGGAAILSVLLFMLLKRFAHRRRPCDIAPHCWATLLPPDQFSFPSGHTMTAFAVSLPLLMFYPELGAGLLFCALSIAVSRIVLGMHFLSDVLAGALLGAGLGCLGFLAFQ